LSDCVVQTQHIFLEDILDNIKAQLEAFPENIEDGCRREPVCQSHSYT